MDEANKSLSFCIGRERKFKRGTGGVGGEGREKEKLTMIMRK